MQVAAVGKPETVRYKLGSTIVRHAEVVPAAGQGMGLKASVPVQLGSEEPAIVTREQSPPWLAHEQAQAR
jgi:hypothetical protein